MTKPCECGSSRENPRRRRQCDRCFEMDSQRRLALSGELRKAEREKSRLYAEYYFPSPGEPPRIESQTIRGHIGRFIRQLAHGGAR